MSLHIYFFTALLCCSLSNSSMVYDNSLKLVVNVELKLTIVLKKKKKKFLRYNLIRINSRESKLLWIIKLIRVFITTHKVTVMGKYSTFISVLDYSPRLAFMILRPTSLELSFYRWHKIIAYYGV